MKITVYRPIKKVEHSFSRKACYYTLILSGVACWMMLLHAFGVFSFPKIPQIIPDPDFSTFTNGVLSVFGLLGFVAIGIPISLGLAFLGFTWLIIIGQSLNVMDEDTWAFADAHFKANPERAVKVIKGLQVLFFIPIVLAIISSIMNRTSD